jgi:hypothetical protein
MAITNILLTAGDQASQPPPHARFGLEHFAARAPLRRLLAGGIA